VKIHYGILSQGQGHIVRSAAMIARLRARGHRVSPFLVGCPPPPYARALLGDFEFHPLPTFALADGKLDLRATAATVMKQLPGALTLAGELARRLRAFDLVLTDLDPVTAWAAWRAGAPSAGISGQYRITRTDAAGPRQQRLAGRVAIELMTPRLGSYFAVSFADASPTRARTRVVAPILDDSVRASPVRKEGFVLAYLYTYTTERVVASLRPPARFRVYGMGALPDHDNIDFCATDRAAFVRDLAACDGVILNGSFQGVCEAAALGKPVLSIPFADQYEEAFNAFHIARTGLGQWAPALTAQAVEAFHDFRARYLPPAHAGSRAPAHAAGDGAAQVIEALGL
jgi:uncharacterized protein (TIGR00661 family)